MSDKRDHGGGVDAAIAHYGGQRADWIDLSTGINPVAYPITDLSPGAWTDLPDQSCRDRLIAAARAFWDVPDDLAILAAPGASALISNVPRLAAPGSVHIPHPTYNEHAASFSAAGWEVTGATHADAQVIVHPNNPDGKVWSAGDIHAPFTIIDESFCDVAPDRTYLRHAPRPGTIILKSFGKFWGLAGLRLGFAIGDPALMDRLAQMLGPWPVSGPALEIGARALADTTWAETTRTRLTADAQRLDTLFQTHGAAVIGGTTLFRLYRVGCAASWQDRLARAHIWTRIFPYATDWIRIGPPPTSAWNRIEDAL